MCNVEKIPVWCRCPLWHHKWQFFSTGFLKKGTSTKEYKWQMGLSVVLWQPEDVLLLTEKGCIVSTYKLPSDWFWLIFSTNQSFQFFFVFVFWQAHRWCQCQLLMQMTPWRRTLTWATPSSARKAFPPTPSTRSCLASITRQEASTPGTSAWTERWGAGGDGDVRVLTLSSSLD